MGNQEELKQIYLVKLRTLEEKMPVYVKEYIEHKRRSCQIRTAISYSYDLMTFFEYLQESNPSLRDVNIKDIPENVLSQLTRKDIEEYQDYLELNLGVAHPHSNGNQSIKKKLSALKGFFTYEIEEGVLISDPTIGMAKRKKENKKPIVRMNEKEVKTLIDTIHQSVAKSKHQYDYLKKSRMRDIAIVTLLLGTGIRVSECAGLDLDDVDLDEHSILVYRKGGKEHYVYFNEQVADALWDYINLERYQYALPDEKALFLSSWKRRLSVRSIQELVTKFTKIAVPNKRITVHKMRSTYGTALYKKTGDIAIVADVLGHSDINTTRKHYADIEEEHRIRAGKLDLYDL